MQDLARAGGIARWTILSLFFLAPIFFVPAPWLSVAQSKFFLIIVFVTVGFVAWVTHTLDTAQLRLPKSSLLFAAALVPVAYLVSAVATGISWISFVGDGRGQDSVIGFVLLYLTFLIAASILGGSRTITALRLFIAGSFAILIVQIAHLVFPTFTFGGALTVPASSIIGSWHDLGIFLAFVVFIALALARTSAFEGFWKPVIALVAIASLALLVIINFSDVWLGLFGLVLFGTFLSYRSARRALIAVPASFWGIKWWLVSAMIALGMFFGGSLVQSALPAPLQVVQIEVRPSWQGTFAVGQKVFAEPAQIFFGSGPNSFLRQWGIHKPLSVNETQFWNTDFYYGIGFIPTSLVTTGIAGILAWSAVCLALLWSLYRALRDPTIDAMRATLIGGAVFLTVFHVLYVPGPALSLLTFLLFGALVAHECAMGIVRARVIPLAWESWRGKVLTVVLVASGILVFIGSVQSVRALVSDIFVNRAVVLYNKTQSTEDATRSINQALGILPQNDRAHRAGVELGILDLSAQTASGDTSDEARLRLESTLRTTIEHGLVAVSIEDKNYQNWLTLARLYGELAGVGVEGADAQAREAYAGAIGRNPSSPLPHFGLAQLELARGNDTAAQEQLEAALAIKQTFVPAHFLLSQIYARANQLERAREHAVAVAQLAPQDPLGWYNLGTVLYVESNYADAVSAFEQAVTIRNNYSNALFFLGLSYYQLDRTDDALRVLETVAVLNPESEVLTDVIEEIKNDEETSDTPLE